MKKFSERLKALRQEHNLSQRALSRALSLSQPAIARWEAGTQVPNIEILIKLATFFDVSTDYMLGLED